jgi:hypothetical protein
VQEPDSTAKVIYAVPSMAVWGGKIHAQNYEHDDSPEVGFPAAKDDDPGSDETCGTTVNGFSH